MTRVLVTNDDGVHAVGLRANVEGMRARGFEVVVVAPDGNRSAMGHHTTIRETLELTRVSDSPGETVWSCSGNPADCVRLAVLAEFIPPVDIVVSGFNHGINLGEDVYYSGTVAAAVEAALMGLPAIAASQSAIPGDTGFLSEKPRDFPFGDHLARVADVVAAAGGLRGVVVNLNYPAELLDSEVRPVGLGSRLWSGSSIVAEPTTNGYRVDNAWATDPPAQLEPGSDYAALVAGAVTVTALQVRGGIAPDADTWQHLRDSGFPMEVR